MGSIRRQALCDQRGVLNAGHIGSEIELRSCRRGRREAAGSLAAGQRVRRGLDEPLVAEPAKERILAAGVVVDPYIATVVIDDLVRRRGVVVEAAGGLGQGVDTGDVEAHLRETVGADDVWVQTVAALELGPGVG